MRLTEFGKWPSIAINTLCKQKENIKLPTVTGSQISSGSIILVKLSVRPLESSSRRFDVVGLGLNSVDLVAEITGHLNPNVKYPARGIYRNAGGQTATALTACAKLEWSARYIGHFGDDDNGSFSESTLIAAGVDVSACRTVPDTTNQFALIIVDQRNGDRTIVWQRDPALRNMFRVDEGRNAQTIMNIGINVCGYIHPFFSYCLQSCDCQRDLFPIGLSGCL